MAPQRRKMDKTPKTDRKNIFSYFFFFWLYFPLLWSHFAPSRTILALIIRQIRFWNPENGPTTSENGQKHLKLPEKFFFPYIFFLQLHFHLLQGHFAPSRTILALIIRQICHTLQNSAFQIWPKIENHPKGGRKNFFFIVSVVSLLSF